MNLQPINPPLRPGQTVQCSRCHRMTADAKADLDAKAGTFVCPSCERMDKLRAAACGGSGEVQS